LTSAIRRRDRSTAWAGQLNGRGADVHAGVVEDEVVEVDERALQPQAGAGVAEVGPGDPALLDRAFGEPLVEPGQGILGDGERAGCRTALKSAT
jgi:hypothetical protein